MPALTLMLVAAMCSRLGCVVKQYHFSRGEFDIRVYHRTYALCGVKWIDVMGFHLGFSLGKITL